MSALALMVFASCDNKGDGPNLDDVVEDGFFVTGAATGTTEISAKLMMTSGVNEKLMHDDKLSWSESRREGMYEKYIILEADKDFSLVLNQNEVSTRYSSALQDLDLSTLVGTEEAYADNPKFVVKRGVLQTGPDAPAMRVEKTGLYHIVLDLNTAEDKLPDGAQIVVLPVEWGVSGSMNEWGYTAFENPVTEGNKISYVMENVDMPANGEFKFKNGGAWKITLDQDGKVKAHTNLGADCKNGGDNIKVEKGGKYTIKLTYELASGEIADSYKIETILTEESTIPTELYIIGKEFGDWNWENPGVVEMVPVNGKAGHFWTIRYFSAKEQKTNEEGNTYFEYGFKFCAKKAWSGDFGGLTTNTGVTVDGNCFFDEAGLYIVYVDLVNSIVAAGPAQVYGMGDAFGSWDQGVHAFTATEDGKKLAATVSAAGELRMYAAAPEGVTSGDWWTREFNIFDGKIEYRGTGGQQNAVAVTANQTVTLDFNAGTGSIQ